MSFQHVLMNRDHVGEHPCPTKPKKPMEKRIDDNVTREEVEAAYEDWQRWRRENDDYKIKLDAYYKEQGKLDNDFWKELEQYCGTQNASEAKRAAARKIAWRYSHDSGYQNVASFYEDISELLT